MDAADKRMLEREALRNMIQQWNANRLDLFELSEPNENLEFHGVMRFYFQDSGQKIATKCIRVASDATVSDVIETLIEKFRPDMRMLSLGSYSLWETHGPDDERRLEPHEKPLLVQLNWHADDREGRFLLKCSTNEDVSLSSVNEKSDQNFKRKLSKREKKELKKKEKLSRLKSDTNNENRPVAEKLYTELPETSFTRSISNPEAVMRRRRQQKLERKLQQFRSKDGGPDTGGTLKIYGSSLCPDVPYKTLLLSVGDTAAGVVREMLDKYGLSRHEPQHFCIVQVDTADNSESILEDDECPLAIVMTHPHRSSIMFHVRRRPADSQPRRRKKKTSGAGMGCGAGGSSARPGSEPVLLEVAPDGSPLENGRRVRITGDMLEVGSGNGSALQLYGPSIQPRHCLLAAGEAGGYTATPLHADAHVFVNGRRVLAPHSLPLQHGCLIKFGRVSTFRFMDPNQENLLNRNLSQSQHFGSGSIYDRSPSGGRARSGALSPASDDAPDYRPRSPDHDYAPYRDDPLAPYNNNTLKLDGDSVAPLDDSRDDYLHPAPTNNSHYKDNYETTFDLDGNVETKSICSAKSGGSGHDNRMSGVVSSAARPGQEAILPAVLEFPEAGQAQFLAAVITRLDPHAPAFKLAPVYTLYLCARYRASTHYRPELTPTERAHKLTAFLHHVATLIHATVQERCTDSAAQAFWMANASELLHFLKCDRHISSFSTQAQELLPATVQNAFSNLVSCFQEELGRALATLNNASLTDATEATAPTLQVLAAAMVLLRRCRVNAALTIQLFSHLFHYINSVCFNKLVTEPGTVSARWGAALAARLALLAAWAERQGLELPADCHLARTHQAARLISGTYRSGAEARAALAACFKLNSVQVRALLAPLAPPDVVDAAAAHARALADELCRADGREITLEESSWLGVGLLIPGDGFSAEVVRGVPPGLAEFVAPLQRGGLCRLAHQPTARGLWTVYMQGYGAPPRRAPQPAVTIIQLHKNCNGMGLSIVAAKGAGQSKLGIYIKSVVPGGAAAADGRLAAGDQLLSVDGQALVGITQEKAAEYLVRTGPTVTLEVAKQGAVLHGLATLLHQPAYNQKQSLESEVQYEDRLRRNSGTFTNPHPALLRPASPRSELATAGYRRPCHDRCHLLRDESTESSTSESEECHPHYHGSIPRLIITLDRENNQLNEDLSPETPGCPLELKCAPPRPVPIFTFTCEDFDEQQASDTGTYDSHVPHEESPPPAPPPPPKPPTPPARERRSESSEAGRLPPQMRPIDTRLTLELFRAHDEWAQFPRRCTAADECVSACECCRAPQPEAPLIPYIDEPAFDPLIVETARAPRTRRILPALSLDRDEPPATADAVCQTPSSPMQVDDRDTSIPATPHTRKLELKLNIDKDAEKVADIQCRLKRTLFNMSKSQSKSEDAAGTSAYSNADSIEETVNGKPLYGKTDFPTPAEVGAKQVLDSVDRKSWKSPDEYRPAFGRVRALTKRFNDIELRYCVKNYKRNCQSSPNLSFRNEKTYKPKENLPTSASLIDIQYESLKTDTSETRGEKMSEDEVKSILIQLEDWSRYGSRGSEDTLAQGNEFELPNLPCEETDHGTSLVFNEIVDKKPKIITLENIRLKSNQSSVTSDPTKSSAESSWREPLVVAVSQKNLPPLDARAAEKPVSRRESYAAIVQSCPDVGSGSARGRTACAGASAHHSCPRLAGPSGASVSAGGARRASERDLPARLAAEPVKPSKSTPALHHAAPPDPPNAPNPPPHGASMQHAASGSVANVSAASAGAGAWAARSRSTHNLAAQPDGFYQNLPAHDSRWSSLRSSTGSNRPQSVHYAPADAPPDSPLQHQQNQNAINARSAKLAEMSEEVTRRQHMQYQLAQQKAATLPPHAHPGQPPMSPNMQHNMQPNMSPNMQHNMQPNMSPNMQHNMQPNMSPNMQLNMHQAVPQMQPNLPQNMQANMQPSIQNMQQSGPSNMSQGMPPNMQQGMQPNTSQGMQPNTSQGMQSNIPQGTQSNMSQNLQSNMPQGMQSNMPQGMQSNIPQNMQSNIPQGMQSNTPQGMQNLQQGMQQNLHGHMQQNLQGNIQQGMQGNMQQGMQMSMQQGNAQAMQNMHHMHQHMNAPAQGYGQPQRYEWHPPGPPSPQRTQPPVAPKPQGVRRPESEMEEQYHQHNQQPQQSTLQPDDERYVASAMEPLAVSPYTARAAAGSGAGAGAGAGAGGASPWQREERERQAEARRAHARSRRDAAIASLLALGASRSPAQSQQLRALQLERDFERRATQHAQEDNLNAETGVDEDSPSPEPEPERAPPQQPPQPLPKSILKTNNNRPDATNGYAQETSPAEESRVSELSGGVSALSVAPPPPSRGSSFAVMATRARALSPPHPPPPHQPTTPHSPPGLGRDKRVSFHERAAPPAPPASSPPPLHDEPRNEDPDRFIEEAESMLAGGLSPPSPPAPPPGAPAHTPGVIGAQEVYRDPRARRLAEKQQAAAAGAAPVPEHLSFKEKMKMFALEAGDPNTPKDKVKISRAQRDIDAVH